MLLYAAVDLINHFFCDRAIIDKTLFYEIDRRESVKFGADLEHIINIAEFQIISIYQWVKSVKVAHGKFSSF